MQALGRVVEAAGPVAREKTFARAPRNRIETRLIFKEGLQRILRAMGGKTTVGWGGEIGCNRIAGRCRSFAQGNSSASVEPSNAVVKLSPLAMICAASSKSFDLTSQPSL